MDVMDNFLKSINYVASKIKETNIVNSLDNTVIETRYDSDGYNHYCYRSHHKKNNRSDGFLVLYIVKTKQEVKFFTFDYNWDRNLAIDTIVKITGGIRDGFVIQAKELTDQVNRAYEIKKLYTIHPGEDHFFEAITKEQIPADYICNIVESTDFYRLFEDYSKDKER